MSLSKYLIWLVLISLPCFAESEKLYIGLDADMSAVAKTGGLAIYRGAQIAIEEINKQGGLLGKQLELIVKDHRGNPARGIDNIESLAKQDNLLAVLGGVHTPVAIQELPLIHQHKLIYLGPWAAGTPIIDNNYEPNYVFRISVRDNEAGKVFIKHAQALKVRKVGLLLEQTAWGRSNEKSITENAQGTDIEIVDAEWFNWGQKDFSKSLTSFIESNVEAIILVANSPSAIEISKSLIKQKTLMSIPIISHWGIAGGDFVSELGLEMLNLLNLSVLQTYSFESPTNLEKNTYVIERYQALFDESIAPKSILGASGVAHAYDLVHLLALAVKSANTSNREIIRTAMENIESFHGLVKHYKPAFTADRHDALMAEDYIMSRFDESGWLVPITTK